MDFVSAKRVPDKYGRSEILQCRF